MTEEVQRPFAGPIPYYYDVISPQLTYLARQTSIVYPRAKDATLSAYLVIAIVLVRIEEESHEFTSLWHWKILQYKLIFCFPLALEQPSLSFSFDRNMYVLSISCFSSRSSDCPSA
jgi:hypothetical protein